MTTRIRANRLQLNVEVVGDGQTILFIHGFPLDHTIWNHQVADLAGWRRIAPDLRGMGRSEVPDGAYSMTSYAADLVALLDALGADRVVLCGLSMGGYIAFEFLRQWRERVAGLVLMDTRAQADGPEARRARDAMAALARTEGARAIAEAMLPKLLGEGTRQRDDETVARVRTMIEATPVTGIIGALEAMRDRSDSTPLLPTISGIPTLVVVGEEDRLTPPDQARSIAEAIPGARLEIVAGAGHLPPMERPPVVTEVVRRFLEKVV
jgi:pimeloyl-ACP methyl ester carboxylesterase